MACIENKGNGSWRITISSGYNPNGSKRRLQRTVKVDPTKTVNAQRKEAEKIAAALETDYRRHLITDGKRITMNVLADEYMTDHVKRRSLAASTAKQYRDLIDGRILPAFGATLANSSTGVKQIDLEPYHPLGTEKCCKLGKGNQFAAEMYSKGELEIKAEKLRNLTDLPVPVFTI